jgi:hypothetical protein
MTQAPTGASGLVRVTVTSGTRRVDLVLPGAVPVAELVPELARSVGVLDAATVYGGYRLVTQDGRELVSDAGLTIQGVDDGGVITVAAVVVAVVLVLGAVVLSRTQGETDAAVTVALMGCVYAAVAGLMIAWDTPFFGAPVAAAGGGALAAGLVAALGLAEARTLLLPPVVVGAVFLATGLLMRASSFDPAVVLTTALALVVIAGSVFPWLALGATGTSVDQLFSTADITADPDRIDPVEVSADARVAHEILVAVSATVGVLLVLVAPLAVSLGIAGALVSVLACLVMMLRTRQYRTGAEVLVGLCSGVLGLVSTALSALWLHPDWRPAAAVALAVTGAVLLGLTLLPQPGSVRRGRLGDLVETVALLALVPALVVATGIYSSIRA